MDLYIFHSWLCEVGGCETVIYNMCEQLKDWYNIKLLYTDGYYKQIERFSKIVATEKYDPKKDYVCDTLIRNSAWGIEPNNITAKSGLYIQMIHADYSHLKKINAFTYKKWKKTTLHVACGEFVAEQFKKTTGYDCIAVKNMLGIKLPVKKTYKYIYAGRITNSDKIISVERIDKFLEMHRKSNINYVLDIYTTEADKVKKFKEDENVHIHNAKYYDLHNEIANADYGILFSEAEGLPCFIQECLQYDTPCIVTNCGGCMELIKDGVNGYVVPMNMNFDINKIKKIPKIKNYDNGTSVERWSKIIGNAKYCKRKVVNNLKRVKVIKPYKDLELNKTFKVGDELELRNDRAEFLEKNRAVKIIANIPENVKEEIKAEVKPEIKIDTPKVKTVAKSAAKKKTNKRK